MKFDFTKFMDAMSAILPAVGKTVETLHADNPNEAVKIELGVGLIQAITATLHQSATSDQTAPVATGNGQ